MQRGRQAQTTRQLTVPPPGAPSVQITSPTDGAHYARGQTVLAGYSCTEGDAGPGISSCTGPVADGQPIDTTTVGQHTFTVTTTSEDGQTSTGMVTYTGMAPSNQFTVSHIKGHRNGTITCQVKVPGPGTIDVLETAWNDNIAHAAVQLQPAPRRFVFARLHKTARRATTLAPPRDPQQARQETRAPSQLPRHAETVGQLHAHRRQGPYRGLYGLHQTGGGG